MSRWAEMFAALSRPADTIDTRDTTPAQQMPTRNCVRSVNCVKATEDEAEARARVDPEQPVVVAADDLDERVSRKAPASPEAGRRGSPRSALCRPRPASRRSAGGGSSPPPACSSTAGPMSPPPAAGPISTCSAAIPIDPTRGSIAWAWCCCSTDARSSLSTNTALTW